MISSPAIGQRTRAFTLLELLIAVAIFAVVLAAINTVFYSALRLRNKATASIEEALPIQQAIAIIKRDLANIVPPGGTLAGELQTTSITNDLPGQASPTFTTATGILDDTSPWAEVQRVSYALVESTNRTEGKDLIRSITRNLLPPTGPAQDVPVQQWILAGVQSIGFLFYDGSQWRDSWDSTTEETKLPQAIKVQIAMVAETSARTVPAPVELVVPLAVQGRTNQTQQATTVATP